MYILKDPNFSYTCTRLRLTLELSTLAISGNFAQTESLSSSSALRAEPSFTFFLFVGDALGPGVPSEPSIMSTLVIFVLQ